MRIFLIGFMGCGKSYIGKRLAKRLGILFIDMDDYLEEIENRKIRKIFKKNGEDYFRQLEKKCLREMTQFENVIISTGGGAPCYFDNADWMNENGITLYLQTPVEVIFKNLNKGRKKRPLLKGLNDEELTTFIEKKLEERNPFYQNVHLIYERQIGGDKAVKELTDYFRMFKKKDKKTKGET